MGRAHTPKEKRQLFHNCWIPARMRDTGLPSSGWWRALDKKQDSQHTRKYDEADNRDVQRSDPIVLCRSHNPGQEDHHSKLGHCDTYDAERLRNGIPLATKQKIVFGQVVLVSP